MGIDPPDFKRNPQVTGKRPPHVKAPEHLSKSPPVPEPGPPAEDEETGGPKGKEPTRYGDWETGGICRDF